MPGMRMVTTVYAIAVPALLGLLMLRLNQALDIEMGITAWVFQCASLTALAVSILARDFRLIAVASVIYGNALVPLLLGNTQSPWWDDRLLVLVNVALFHVLTHFRLPIWEALDSPTPYWLWIVYAAYLALNAFFFLGLLIDWSGLTEFILINAAGYLTVFVVVWTSFRRITLGRAL